MMLKKNHRCYNHMLKSLKCYFPQSVCSCIQLFKVADIFLKMIISSFSLSQHISCDTAQCHGPDLKKRNSISVILKKKYFFLVPPHFLCQPYIWKPSDNFSSLTKCKTQPNFKDFIICAYIHIHIY